jgi:hypothetical protein
MQLVGQLASLAMETRLFDDIAAARQNLAAA